MTKASLMAAALLGVAVLASAPQVQAQARPPWCSTQKSLNAAECTICASQSLSDLNNQLSLIFASALKSVGKQRARLQKTQADWVCVTRNGCNDDDSCLTDVYQRVKPTWRGRVTTSADDHAAAQCVPFMFG